MLGPPCPSLHPKTCSRSFLDDSHATRRRSRPEGIPRPADQSLSQKGRRLLRASRKSVKARSGDSQRGSCYGCGALLQTLNPRSPGYVEAEKYEVKRKHKQLDQLICGRCQQLSNGAMVPAVQDLWSLQAAQEGRLPLIPPERLKEELAGIRDSRSLIIMLVDLLDCSASFVSKIRDIAGRNPIVLVGTKVDLLPKGTDLQDVADWLQDMALARKVNVIHTSTVSSRTGESIPETAAFIRKNRLGRDVYIVGAANVGKSAFCRALMREMSNALSRQYDVMAASSNNRLPVESAMSGTTLKLIPLKAFHSGGQLIDTPGLHLAYRLPHMLKPEEAKQLHARGRIRPYVAPCIADAAAPSPPGNEAAEYSASYKWGGIARIQMRSRLESAFLTFYGPPALRVSVEGEATAGDEQLDWSNQQIVSEPEFAATSVQNMGGLALALQSSVQCQGQRTSLLDIAISGVPGWITIAAGSRGRIAFNVWTARGVQVFLRPPIPCPNPALDQTVERRIGDFVC